MNDKDDPPASPLRGWAPIPDPTALTTDQLRREITTVRELVQTQMDVLRQRLDDMDKATELLSEITERHTDIAIKASADLYEQRLAGIATQIADRDVSVATAFSAAKEQSNERQSSIDKQLEQLTKLIDAGTGKVSERVDDLRERMTSMESWSKGVAEHKKSTGDNWGIAFGAASAIWAVVATIAALLAYHR